MKPTFCNQVTWSNLQKSATDKYTRINPNIKCQSENKLIMFLSQVFLAQNKMC